VVVKFANLNHSAQNGRLKPLCHIVELANDGDDKLDLPWIMKVAILIAAMFLEARGKQIIKELREASKHQKVL